MALAASMARKLATPNSLPDSLTSSRPVMASSPGMPKSMAMAAVLSIVMPRLAKRAEAFTASPVVSSIQSSSPPPRAENVMPTPAHMAQSRATMVSTSGMVSVAMAMYCQSVARVIVPLAVMSSMPMMVAESSVGKLAQWAESMVAPSAPVSEMSSPPGPMAL